MPIIISGATIQGGVSVSPPPPILPVQKAIFGYGYNANSGTEYSLTNIVTNTGVVGTNVTGVGTARSRLAAAGYGGDKAIFGFGRLVTGSPTALSITNLVSNTGVVANDTAGVGTGKNNLAAATYAETKAIFGYGLSNNSTNQSTTNLVTDTGVVGTDVTGVGTARYDLAAAGYGTDKAIFGFGIISFVSGLTNLVSNTGVVANDTAAVGTARYGLAAAGYGTDKAIFGYGGPGVNNNMYTLTNLVSNTGVVATDTSGVGTPRFQLAASTYGTDKVIFGYGVTGSNGSPSPNFTVVSMTNLVSNTGVVAGDTTGVGTARQGLAAAGFSN